MERKVNIFNSLDWFSIALYFILVIAGCLNIYAAAYNDEHSSIFDISQRYGKQILLFGVAIVLIVIILIIDSQFYSFFAYGIYGFTLILLIAVLIFGKEVNGARSWFDLGIFLLQPAEFAKFATTLAIAKLLSSGTINLKNINIFWIIFSFVFFPIALLMRLFKKGNTGFAYVVLLLILPSSLILLQNDTGSAIIYVSFLILLYREGLSTIFLLFCLIMAVLFVSALLLGIPIILISIIFLGIVVYWLFSNKIKEVGVAVGILLFSFSLCWGVNKILSIEIKLEYLITIAIILSSVVYFLFSYRYKLFNAYFIISIVLGSVFFTHSVNYVFTNVLEEHQKDRIEILLGLKSDPLGVEYNVNQSKIAIGSGGALGKGFLNGTQTKFNFVPEQTTDFIFCTVGEEWGYLGTTFVVILFSTLLLRLIYLAERQRSQFSRIYGYGVVSILFFHVAINIGMTIGLAPVIGIPLPFFSYGGSSLLSFTILLFIFLRLDAGRKQLMK